MNELIERLAKEAGLTDPDLGPWMIDYGGYVSELAKFAHLIAEECADLINESWRDVGLMAASDLADAIRAKFPPPEVTG